MLSSSYSSKAFHFPRREQTREWAEWEYGTQFLPIQHSIILNDRHLFMVLHKYVCVCIVHLFALALALLLYHSVFFLLFLWFVTNLTSAHQSCLFFCFVAFYSICFICKILINKWLLLLLLLLFWLHSTSFKCKDKSVNAIKLTNSRVFCLLLSSSPYCSDET